MNEDRADTDTPEFPPVAGAAPGNDMNFHGRHIFVIGGSRGIGASCVEMLARRGAVSRAASTQRRGPCAHPLATVVCRPLASHTLPTAARPSSWRCAPAARLRGPASGGHRHADPCPSSDAELGEGGGGGNRRRVSGRRGQPGGDGGRDDSGGGPTPLCPVSRRSKRELHRRSPRLASLSTDSCAAPASSKLRRWRSGTRHTRATRAPSEFARRREAPDTHTLSKRCSGLVLMTRS